MKIKEKLVVIFIIAFFVRIISLNQSLWLDEATTARVVKEYGFTEIVTQFSPNDFHPPLYYLFMKVWTNVFGISEIALRFPSIIFSLLTGVVIYMISRLLPSMTGFGEAKWAAIFFLFNPLIIYYSQEARMYMMATFFLMLSLYFFLGLISNIKDQKSKIHIINQKWKDIFLFSLFIVLGLLTFYGSIFFIIPMILYLFYKKQYRFFFISLFIIIFSLVLLSPLLVKQLKQAKESMSIVTNWANVLGKANLKNLALIPLKFSIGRISFYPKWLYWLVSGVWTLFVFYFVVKGGFSKYQRSKIKYQTLRIGGQNDISNSKNILFILLILPLLLGFILSLYTPLLQYFRFIYLIPFMCLFLALGLNNSIYRYIIIGGFVFFSLIYLLNPNQHREDWRSLAQSLPEGIPVYMVYSSSDPLKYYREDMLITDLKFISQKHPKDKNIIIIPYTADIHGINYQDWLEKIGSKRTETKYFRGLSYEIWKDI